MSGNDASFHMRICHFQYETRTRDACSVPAPSLRPSRQLDHRCEEPSILNAPCGKFSVTQEYLHHRVQAIEMNFCVVTLKLKSLYFYSIWRHPDAFLLTGPTSALASIVLSFSFLGSK